MKYNEKYFFESISFGLPLSSLSLTGTVADAIISDSVSFYDWFQSAWLHYQAIPPKMEMIEIIFDIASSSIDNEFRRVATQHLVNGQVQ